MSGTPYGDTVMTAHEAAEELGYVYSTFIQSYKNWGIPAETIAGRTMFYREDIAKFKAGRVPEKYGTTTRWRLPQPWERKGAA